MSRITLAPNASGTGTLTIAAPNTNTDRTLTLPDVTTTLVGTDASQTLTNKSIAGSQLTGTVASSLLTGALPAIDGSALTGIATGGMTLLGTLTTTSGATQTLSGLTLTSYKLLYMFFNNVSGTINPAALWFSGGYVIAPSGSNANGNAIVDLTYGKYIATAYSGGAGTAAATSNYGNPSITTSSTSIVFVMSAGNFANGSITIYGVK
jgi:hypothetical protein